MIVGVVIHLLNEQPVLADLFAMPTAADVSLVCTNIRTQDGKRPVFIDATQSVFVFPYHNVRFIEIPQDREAPAGQAAADEPAPAQPAAPDDEDLEIDEDFLRRIREA